MNLLPSKIVEVTSNNPLPVTTDQTYPTVSKKSPSCKPETIRRPTGSSTITNAIRERKTWITQMIPRSNRPMKRKWKAADTKTVMISRMTVVIITKNIITAITIIKAILRKRVVSMMKRGKGPNPQKEKKNKVRMRTFHLMRKRMHHLMTRRVKSLMKTVSHWVRMISIKKAERSRENMGSKGKGRKLRKERTKGTESSRLTSIWQGLSSLDRPKKRCTTLMKTTWTSRGNCFSRNNTWWHSLSNSLSSSFSCSST